MLWIVASIEEKGMREVYMRMRLHYPKKGVIRVFVDTFSKINSILFCILKL